MSEKEIRQRKLKSDAASHLHDRKALKRPHDKVYGDQTSICLNASCVLRKNARCFGFEGCPGFKGK